MKKIFYFIIFFGYDMACRNAFAAEEITTPDFFSMLVRMFSVLAFVLGIMLVALYFVKKMGFKSGTFLGTQRYMEIVDKLYLGPKKSIALLKVDKEFVLIGLSSNQITYLSKVDVSMDSDTGDSKSGNEGLYGLLSKKGEMYAKENSLSPPFPFGTEISHAGNFLKSILNRTVFPQKRNKVAKRKA